MFIVYIKINMYICIMINIYLQYWKLSDKNLGVIPNGCTLHNSLEDTEEYVSNVYKDRDDDVISNSYIRIVGKPIIASISDSLYASLMGKKVLSLKEVEMNNLINCEDLKVT